MLKHDELFEFVKIINHFKLLKGLELKESPLLERWFGAVRIPEEIDAIAKAFDAEGEIKPGVLERLDSIRKAIETNREKSKSALRKIISLNKLQNYLVDRQIHFVDGLETLLLRGGFNHVIKGSIISRSSSGFFYVLPNEISSLREKHDSLINERESLLYDLAKEYSDICRKFLKFLKFINGEFDRFDHYQARAVFANMYDYEFLFPAKTDEITLSGFAHPALHDPVPINLEFKKKILMITGVNAGGKTMLLKSILSSALMSKYMIPFKIDAKKSVIPYFKKIEAIIEDPQNVKNDISTFAGRMMMFSELFGKKEALVGVDEIELGTDSDEAASLFKVILEQLAKRSCKTIITTHHKRLASLMAGHEDVELLAALYDEQEERPTFGFLKGTIGKSYAFETAKRYGIPGHIVNEARDVYGEDKERLNELIQRSSELEMELGRKAAQLDEELNSAKMLKNRLKEDVEKHEKRFREERLALQMEYKKALDIAKDAAKKSSKEEMHKSINNANRIVANISHETKTEPPKEFKVGDRVKYNNTKGVIIELSSKSAMIETDKGMKLKVKKKELRPSGNPAPAPPPRSPYIYSKPQKADIKLDLHGLYSDEAIERLDKFISDALLSGFDELLVYHGIGTGRLSKAVREFLDSHPRVKEYKDAPPGMGGYGAKLIYI